MIVELREILKNPNKYTDSQVLLLVKGVVDGYITRDELEAELYHMVGAADPAQDISTRTSLKEIIALLKKSTIPRDEWAHLEIDAANQKDGYAFVMENYARLNLNPGGYVKAKTPLGKKISYLKNRAQIARPQIDSIAEAGAMAGLTCGFSEILKVASKPGIGDTVKIKTEAGIRLAEVVRYISPFRIVLSYGRGTVQVEGVYNITDILPLP